MTSTLTIQQWWSALKTYLIKSQELRKYLPRRSTVIPKLHRQLPVLNEHIEARIHANKNTSFEFPYFHVYLALFRLNSPLDQSQSRPERRTNQMQWRVSHVGSKTNVSPPHVLVKVLPICRQLRIAAIEILLVIIVWANRLLGFQFHFVVTPVLAALCASQK